MPKPSQRWENPLAAQILAGRWQVLVSKEQPMGCSGPVGYGYLLQMKMTVMAKLKLRGARDGWLVCGLALLAAFAAGCDRDNIRVYRVAKESAAPPTAAPEAHTHGAGETPIPQLTWTLPAGWQEVAAGEMRVANFTLSGKGGQRAEVSVIPLPGVTGRDLDLVNMWRGQLGLGAATADEIGKQTETVSVGADQGKLFQIVSDKPVRESAGPVGLLVAVLEKDNVGWFFKMIGDSALVEEQKPVFIQFLKQVGFREGSETLALANRPRAQSTNVKTTPRDNANRPAWVIPPGWEEAPAGQMLVAKFIVPGSGGTRAELNVSQLGGLGGGILPNVNRWRGQLGLPALAESDLDKQTQALDLGGSQGMLVDISGTEVKTGEKARLLAAIVPQTGQTWFYKLMGNEQVVEREKGTFMKFVQTAKYRE